MPALPATSHTRTGKPCLLSLTTKAAPLAPGSRSCQVPCGLRQPTHPARPCESGSPGRTAARRGRQKNSPVPRRSRPGSRQPRSVTRSGTGPVRRAAGQPGRGAGPPPPAANLRRLGWGWREATRPFWLMPSYLRNGRWRLGTVHLIRTGLRSASASISSRQDYMLAHPRLPIRVMAVLLAVRSRA